MNKKILIPIIIISILYFFKNTINNTIKNIFFKNNNPETILIKPKYYLINVLNQKEFDDANIFGSTHVPFSEINIFLDKIEEKNIPLIFYCSNYYCTSSDMAATIAIKKNFKNVYVYKGGMAEWYQANLEDPNFSYNGPAKAEYLKLIILPEEEIINIENDIIDEDEVNIEKYKIISIKDLQNFLKEGIILK